MTPEKKNEWLLAKYLWELGASKSVGRFLSERLQAPQPEGLPPLDDADRS
jgi:hypothetical protein